MKQIKKMLKELCFLPSVSGRERKSKEALFKIAENLFETSYEDAFGNFVFVKKSTKENAPKLMIDAHFDEVGMMVSQIHEDGFLSIVPIGGLDTRVLGATEVIVYGEKEIYGVLSSIPPHLSGGKTKDAPKIENIYIDTGLDKETLQKLVPMGSVVDFKPSFTELANDRVLAKSLDDKSCVCAIFDMVSRAEKEKLEYDIYVTISAQEETGKNGARFVSYDIEPDIAIITDVNFASGEGIESSESIEIGEGAGVDISSLVNIRLTRNLMKMLDVSEEKYQKICEPTRTGTNNDLISISNKGVKTILMSIPLDGMHTPCEIVSLRDIKSLSNILLKIVYTSWGNL